MSDKMTARVAMLILKSERASRARAFEEDVLSMSRLDRAQGVNPAEGTELIKAAAKRVDDAYEYALGSLTLSRKSGKSALKECERWGFTVGDTTTDEDGGGESGAAPVSEAVDPGASAVVEGE